MDVCPCEIVRESFCLGNDLILKPGEGVSVSEENGEERGGVGSA